MIAYDIETIPNVDLIDLLPEPEVAIGNTKDPEKIKAKIQEAKEDQVKKMALDPFYGRICSYAVYGQDVQKYHVLDEISDAAEIELIRESFEHMVCTGTTSPQILTWNGFNFDMPFLFKRAMVLKMELPSGLWGLSRWCKKYTRNPHCDLMQEMVGWNGQMKLDKAAANLLGEKKLDHIGFDKFIDAIKAGTGDRDIGLYNLKDVELLYRLYNHVSPYLF